MVNPGRINNGSLVMPLAHRGKGVLVHPDALPPNSCLAGLERPPILELLAALLVS